MHFIIYLLNYKINSEAKPFYTIVTFVEDFFKENKVKIPNLGLFFYLHAVYFDHNYLEDTWMY